MEENIGQDTKKKKPYSKPDIKKVPLRPEEAVLGFCKTSGQFGPGSSGCQTPAPCSGLGS